MKFCPECGTKRFENAKFCHECGFGFQMIEGIGLNGKGEKIEESSSQNQVNQDPTDDAPTEFQGFEDIFNTFFGETQTPENEEVKLKAAKYPEENQQEDTPWFDTENFEQNMQKILAEKEINIRVESIGSNAKTKAKTIAKEMATQAADKAIDHLKENGIEYAKMIAKTIITKKK
jgi:hypothetical protein